MIHKYHPFPRKTVAPVCLFFSSHVAFSLPENIFQVFYIQELLFNNSLGWGEGGVNTPDGAVALRLSTVP